MGGDVSLQPVDILIDIRYGFNGKRAETCVYTNAKPEALDELLGNCILDEVCKFLGRDPNPLNESTDLYTVKVGYWFDGDCFAIESDTNNRGMNVGILMAVMGELRSEGGGCIPVKPLAERAQ